jgi:hypothetical protein
MPKLSETHDGIADAAESEKPPAASPAATSAI